MNSHENGHSDEIICFFCGSTNLYRDGDNDNLICGDCNTQSQSLSQRETTEDNDQMQATNKRSSSVSARSKVPAALVEDEANEDFRIPSLLECTEAFLSLVKLAARKSVSEDKVPNLDKIPGFSEYKERIVADATEIFLLYLERWDESANYFMLKFPELRISMRDRFLTDSLREKMLLQMSRSAEDTVHKEVEQDSSLMPSSHSSDNLPSLPTHTRSPKRIRWNVSDNEILTNSEQNINEHDCSSENGDQSRSSPVSTHLNGSNAKKLEQLKALIGEADCKIKDEMLGWRLAILELSPDLDLLTSIVYLAHLCSQTGVSSHHFMIWAEMGKYPFLTDAFGQLEDKYMKKLQNLKNVWCQDFSALVRPEKLDRIATILLMCLVDPDDPRVTFLSNLYHLNLQRIKNAGQLNVNCEKAAKFSVLERCLSSSGKKLKKQKGNSTPGTQFEDENEESGESSHNNDISEIETTIPESFYNVGMMINLFCAHLGLTDQVLLIAYALIGANVYYNQSKRGDDSIEENDSCKNECHVGLKLPSPLKTADPRMLVSPLHVIAVIVVACKFSPGWEQWLIQALDDDGDYTWSSSPTGRSDHKKSPSSNDGPPFVNSEDRSKRKRSEVRTTTARDNNSSGVQSIWKLERQPYCEFNGDESFDYLDFMRKSQTPIRHHFKDSLSVCENQVACGKSRRLVAGSSILVSRIVNDTTMSVSEARNDHELGHYLAYDGDNVENSMALHESYLSLIAFISKRLIVNRRKLHRLVTNLDKELIFNSQSDV